MNIKMDTIIEFDIPQDRSANLIKVIGVGGRWRKRGREYV